MLRASKLRSTALASMLLWAACGDDIEEIGSSASAGETTGDSDGASSGETSDDSESGTTTVASDSAGGSGTGSGTADSDGDTEDTIGDTVATTGVTECAQHLDESSCVEDSTCTWLGQTQAGLCVPTDGGVELCDGLGPQQCALLEQCAYDEGAMACVPAQ
jgi:hypothetical protein